MEEKTKTIKLGDKELILKTGGFAEQADGAVMAQIGGTVVLATVVSADISKDLGYFPLQVEYIERLSAGGRIKGSRWVKRPGRPGDEEVLAARLIDRSIRPLFPEGYNKDVQVIVSVLSIDQENPPDMVAGAAVSAAIEISPLPWNGPVAILRVGSVDGELVINPRDEEIEKSDMDMIVSVVNGYVVMIEAGANQIEEKKLVEGIRGVEKLAAALNTAIKELAKEVGKKKEIVEKQKFDPNLVKHVKKVAQKQIEDLVEKMADKRAGYADMDAIKDAVKESVETDQAKDAGKIFEDLYNKEVRKRILSGKRADGRKPDELRELSAKVQVLPRIHGSAIFNRGNTQALSVATLGAPSLEQLIETAEGEESKRYLHHYSMPPYSVGETGRIGWPSRREVGHGALAERALLPVIPSEEDFPYTIQVQTEILSSNGSTSMASVCGSTLSLMDAGVPIKTPIAGIAMGLVIENEDEYVVLTDIVGIEDGSGDMDFKVAGSREGVTALQMDVKSLNLTVPMLEKALIQAKDARMQILDVMESVIKEPRKEVSEFAPKIKIIKIDPAKIGELIGPGGKTIKKIIAETQAQIDVDDDGSVFVCATDEKNMQDALERVEAITKDPVPGEIYEGEVKRIQQFGAFVEILPGKDGLVHVSDMSTDYVKDPNDYVKVGDRVTVKVKEIDELRRLNLTMVLDDTRSENNRRGNGGRADERRKSGGQRSGRERFDRNKSGHKRSGSDNKYSNKGRRDNKSGGPHFPASRLMDDSNKKNF